MLGDKFRFRFRKVGDLRWLSHLDLVRGFERLLRRAEIPFKSTQGFHPTPRMVFALSLPLGFEGRREVLELELSKPFEADEIRERLNRFAPSGLHFDEARIVEMKATAVPRSVIYSVEVPSDRMGAARFRANELLASDKVWVERLKPRPRKVNIRPYLRSFELLRNGDEPWAMPKAEKSDPFRLEDSTLKGSDDLAQGNALGTLAMNLWVTQNGTARADELLKLLGLEDCPAARSDLAIRDETPPGQPDAPPDGAPDLAPLEYTPVGIPGDDSAEPEWGLSPNGPIVE